MADENLSYDVDEICRLQRITNPSNHNGESIDWGGEESGDLVRLPRVLVCRVTCFPQDFHSEGGQQEERQEGPTGRRKQYMAHSGRLGCTRIGRGAGFMTWYGGVVSLMLMDLDT